MLKLDALPQLSVGAHQAGTHRACIMNAISYLQGDTLITDVPSCVWKPFALIAQRINDTICGPACPAYEEPVKVSLAKITLTEAQVIAGTPTLSVTPKLLCGACSHKMWLFGAGLIGTQAAFEAKFPQDCGHRDIPGELKFMHTLLSTALRRGHEVRGVEVHPLVERAMTEEPFGPAEGVGIYGVNTELWQTLEHLAHARLVANSPASRSSSALIQATADMMTLPVMSPTDRPEKLAHIWGVMACATDEHGIPGFRQHIPAAEAMLAKFKELTQHVPLLPTAEDIADMAERVGLKTVPV